MDYTWYFSDELSPSNEYVDKFADSKFGTDKWGSFAREIIQNSLDAQDDENQPVKVVFDLNTDLSIEDIPGGLRTKDILGRCKDIATNPHTKSYYTKGLEILSKDKVYCLKISDYNTKGVRTGRDEAWGALVFDEGKSVKLRPGSAGSHGVGKKVPFIISTCNTVFYATKNKYKENDVEKSDCLIQGKTTLINWTDSDGKRKNSKGWFGVINETDDPQNKIQPINATCCPTINPYFKRMDEYGTDVIIVGANIYDQEDTIKASIISAILENFFVAILKNKLVINVFGIEINSTTFQSAVKKYYSDKYETKNNLLDCIHVFSGEPSDSINIEDKNGAVIGSADIYFRLGNRNNKKYYTIVRSHGMRIMDKRLNRASQPYTAVVLIQGKELNSLLSKLENAAHDNFVTDDESIEIDINAIEAYQKLEYYIGNYIDQKTKIDAESGQELEGLSDIISIPGSIISVKRKTIAPVIKRHRVPKKGTGSKSKDYDAGKSGAGDGDGKRKTRNGSNKPAKEGKEFASVLYENYVLEPLFIMNNEGYALKLAVKENLKNAEIRISSINSEGKLDDSIVDFIDSVSIGGVVRKCPDGKINNIHLNKNTEHTIQIKMKKRVKYQLSANLHVKECDINE